MLSETMCPTIPRTFDFNYEVSLRFLYARTLRSYTSLALAIWVHLQEREHFHMNFLTSSVTLLSKTMCPTIPMTFDFNYEVSLRFLFARTLRSYTSLALAIWVHLQEREHFHINLTSSVKIVIQEHVLYNCHDV